MKNLEMTTRLLSNDELNEYRSQVDECNKIYGEGATDLESYIATVFYQYEIIDKSTVQVWEIE